MLGDDRVEVVGDGVELREEKKLIQKIKQILNVSVCWTRKEHSHNVKKKWETTS